MRQFARPFPMDRLSLEARVLYTGFLLFLAAGFVSSVWLFHDSFGDLSPGAARTYYRGASTADTSAPTVNAIQEPGPTLDLPMEEHVPASAPLRLEKPARQVMETFHFHLFTVPVVLLIVGHLFMLTSLGRKLKIAVIALASVTTFAHLLAPLMVRFGSSDWSWLFPVSAVGAAVGWAPLILWPLWELWRPGSRPE